MFATSFRNLDSWSESLEALTTNIRKTYRQLRRDGVVGMSRGNLRQIVSTAGVSVHPSQFDRLLDQAIERADLPEGFIY